MAWRFKSDETDLSTPSQSLDSYGTGSETGSESTGIDDITRLQYSSESEKLSPEEKITMLLEMFPTLKPFDVEYVLKKVEFQYGKAVEELLNQVFHKEDSQAGNQVVKKGVDGFFDPENSRGRKRHGKKKRQTRGASSASSPLADPSTVRDRWDRVKEEIDFIQQRTFLSHQTVSSAYHKAGASLASTIAALCAAPGSNPYLTSNSQSTLQTHISELSSKFPGLSRSQATALVHMSHPSTASAHELAGALATSLKTSSSKIAPHYLLRPPSPLSKELPAKSFANLPASTASQLASARSTAFAQAHNAHRKSKSNPLMGGAASYYSSVGREASASLKRHKTAMAEQLVSSQSKPGEVDLHGVRVQDAVRIAKEKAESWWENEGREWAREGKVMEGGLRIVTGAGKHSQGGKGRIGPAVGAMLVKGGWKVEFGEGFLDILGKARR